VGSLAGACRRYPTTNASSDKKKNLTVITCCAALAANSVPVMA